MYRGVAESIQVNKEGGVRVGGGQSDYLTDKINAFSQDAKN